MRPGESIPHHDQHARSGTSTLGLASDQSQPRGNDEEVEARSAKRRKTALWMESQSKGVTPITSSLIIIIADMKKAMAKTLQKDCSEDYNLKAYEVLPSMLPLRRYTATEWMSGSKGSFNLQRRS
jgi:hypothetical protein